MKNKYFINNVGKIGAKAGSKAKSDINKILLDNGYEEIAISYKFHVPGKKIKEILRRFEGKVVLGRRKITSEDLICIQVPSWFGAPYDSYIIELKKKLNFKMLLIIHDIEQLRETAHYSKKYYEIEKQFFLIADCIICHNQSMKKYLIQQGVSKNKIVILGIFDYILSKNFDSSCITNNGKQDKNLLSIAGNLSPEKSGYLYQFDKLSLSHIKIKAYGYGMKGNINNISYSGLYGAEEIPYILNETGGWGLVWDGDSLDEPSGTYGNYLKYNNPHKVSLYLSSGLPVIVWSGLGIAEFIKENNLGLLVESLRNLDEITGNISEEEFSFYKKNVISIQNKLIKGYFAKKAITEAERYISHT